MRVGLGEHERDPLQRRGEPDRAGDVAAAAEHGVGLPARAGSARAAPSARAGLARRARAAFSGLERLMPSTAIAVERVAGGGDELGLGALAADEA